MRAASGAAPPNREGNQMAEQDIKRAEVEISVTPPARPAAAQPQAKQTAEACRVRDTLEDDEVAEALKLLHDRIKD
jgi:hypothetical protein